MKRRTVEVMTPTEKRLADIYSYYLTDCYEDDFGGSFAEWMIGNMYGEELTKLAEQCLTDALEEGKR